MMRFTTRTILITSAAAAAFIAAVPAQAQARSFDVPAQSATKALPEFARQAGIQIVAPGSRLRGLRTRAVRGDMDVRAALARMIAGTGLRIASDDGATISLTAERAEAPGEPARNDAGGSARAERLAVADEAAQSPEIIVTAQRREENVQDVPISITVLGGQHLDSFTQEGVMDALEMTPGVTIDNNILFGGSQISIRGVAAGGTFVTGAGPVATYIDSVPFGFVKSSFVPDMSPYDMDRVEILRGPQGSLYGASSLNGTVRVLTHAPDLDSFELKARTSFATTLDGGDSYRGDLAINLPLVEGKLGARAVIGYNHVGGWIDNVPILNRKDANDHKIGTLRLKLKAQPTERLALGFTAWFSRTDSGIPDLADPEENYAGAFSTPTSEDFDVYATTVDYDFPSFVFSSATSYIDYKRSMVFDYTPVAPFLETLLTEASSKVFAQEVSLRSTGDGPWRWTVGGFYRDAKDRVFQEGLAFANQFVDYTDASRSFAAFGELTRIFLDGQIELTGGARYFVDQVTQYENLPFDKDFSRPLIRTRDTFRHLSPRVTLTWLSSDQATFYASYGQGFRSGSNQYGAIVAEAPHLRSTKEDVLTNYELGAKGSFLDGRLGYEIAMYYMDWQDVQQNILADDFGNYPCDTVPCHTAFVNGISASGLGFDIAVNARLTDRLTLTPGFSWNDLKWDKTVPGFFIKGERAPYSVEYTLSGTADYRFPTGVAGLDGRLTINGSYSPAPDVVAVGSAQDKIMINASLALTTDRWTARLYADNLTDERNTSGGFPNFDGGLSNLTLRQRPRAVGVQLELKY